MSILSRRRRQSRPRLAAPGSNMAGKIITGIDIGSNSIKFVAARKGKNGKLQVLNAGIASLGNVASIPEGDARDEAIAAVLKSLLADRRARVGKVHTCISGKKVITRYAHVPPMPAHRLDKVMAFEMASEATGAGEDVASDYRLLDLPNKASEFTLLVGMAKEEVIRSHAKIFSSVGIGIEDTTLGSLPTFHSFILSRKAELEAMQAPCAVVNIGADKMEVVVLFGSRLYFARNLTPGGNAFTEAIQQELRIPFDKAEALKIERGRIGGAADAKDGIPVIPIALPEGTVLPDDEDTALGSPADAEVIPILISSDQHADQPPAGGPHSEGDPLARMLDAAAHGVANSIQSCLRYAKAQTKLPNLDINRIYITGGCAKLPGLALLIQNRLGIETAEFDPLENVDYSPLDPAGREMIEANRHAFATAIGLVAGRIVERSMDISLLPKSTKKRRDFMTKAIYGWAAAGVFTVTVIMMLAGSYKGTSVIKQFTGEQSAKIEQSKTGEEELTALKAANLDLAEKTTRLSQLTMENHNYLSALALLKNLVPREIELRTFQSYMGSQPPEPKLDTGKKKFVKPVEEVKQPRIYFLAGTIADEVDLSRGRDILQKFVYKLEDYDGALEVGKAVQKVKLPATRQTLLKQAGRNNAPDYAVHIINRLPERSYTTIEEVTKAVSLDPLGRRLFKKVIVPKAVAETQKNYFEIILQLNEE